MNKIASYFCFFSFVFAMGMIVCGMSNEDENFHSQHSAVLAGYPASAAHLSRRVTNPSTGAMTLVIKVPQAK